MRISAWMEPSYWEAANNTIFAGDDVIQRQRTSFDPPSWHYYLHLSISLFLKRSKETMEINTKQIRNVYEMYKFISFRN